MKVDFDVSKFYSFAAYTHVFSASAAISEGKSFTGHTNYVTSVIHTKPTEAFPNGLIVTGSNDRLIRAFKNEQAEPVFILHGHLDTVCSLDSNDEGLLLSGSWDSTAKIWNTDSALCTIERPGVTIWCVVFLPPSSHHPDELLIATGHSDSVIAIWSIPRNSLCTGFQCTKPTRTLVGHTDCIRSLAVLGERRLISASNDGSLRCWNLDTSSCVAEFYGHTNYVYSVAVDPARRFIVSSGEDRTVRVWPLPTDGLGFVQQLECEQTLFLPCQTAWCVTVTSSADIAVGCRLVKLMKTNTQTVQSLAVLSLHSYCCLWSGCWEVRPLRGCPEVAFRPAHHQSLPFGLGSDN